MKSLKKLKMFILAVGLACGVHVFSASAMEPEQPKDSLGNTEDYDAYGGELPYFSVIASDIEAKTIELSGKIDKVIYRYNEERKKLIKLNDNNTKIKNEYSTYDPVDKEIVKMSEKEFQDKARPIVENLQSCDTLERQYRLQRRIYDDELDDIYYPEIERLKRLEKKKEMEFDNLMIKIFEKRGKLIELKKRKDILEQKYLKEKNDLKQSGTDNTGALAKRANCFEELKKLEKINKDCKELENEIKEEDKKLIELGAELNRIDQKRGRTDHKGWIRPVLVYCTLNAGSDNERGIHISWKDKLDMRKNGTSKHWEKYLGKEKYEKYIKEVMYIKK